MRYEKWNKQTDVYDLSPDQVIANNARYRDEDSYIIYRDDGSIFDIVLLADMPNPDGLTDSDEICAAFISGLEQYEPALDKITAEEALSIIFGGKL